MFNKLLFMQVKNVDKVRSEQAIRILLQKVEKLERRVADLESKDNSEYCINGSKAGREPWQDRSN